MKELALALLSLVLLLIGSSSGQLAKSCPHDNLGNVNVVFDDIKRTSGFGLDLFKQIKAEVPGKNLFFSSYSVWSALAIAYFGAEGNTLAQLQKVLRLGDKDKGYKLLGRLSDNLLKNEGVELQEANRAYFTDALELEQCFKKGDFYEVHQFDFSNSRRLAKEVNDFVSNTTRGLIKEIVTAGSVSQATFVLVNAIYFKGLWEQKFDKMRTRPANFSCSPGRSCGQVEMMQRAVSDVDYVNDATLEAEIIDLPYINSSISMLLFLPWKNVSSVDKIIDRLDLRTLEKTVSDLRKRSMLIKLPKFKMEETLDDEMRAAIIGLGITDLFTKNADLTGFTTTLDLNVDVVIHKAVVDVTEEGTEAAAATVLFDTRIAGPRYSIITFDRPFVFLIVDKELGLTLFSGVFRNPPS